MSSRRAISAWVSLRARRARTLVACKAAVGGRPRRFPSRRTRSSPPRTRSRSMSRSNSAKTASIVASARPLGVDKSSASVSETNATPSVESFVERRDPGRRRSAPSGRVSRRESRRTRGGAPRRATRLASCASLRPRPPLAPGGRSATRGVARTPRAGASVRGSCTGRPSRRARRSRIGGLRQKPPPDEGPATPFFSRCARVVFFTRQKHYLLADGKRRSSSAFILLPGGRVWLALPSLITTLVMGRGSASADAGAAL